jgi:hypothetical protein
MENSSVSLEKGATKPCQMEEVKIEGTERERKQLKIGQSKESIPLLSMKTPWTKVRRGRQGCEVGGGRGNMAPQGRLVWGKGLKWKR